MFSLDSLPSWQLFNKLLYLICQVKATNNFPLYIKSNTPSVVNPLSMPASQASPDCKFHAIGRTLLLTWKKPTPIIVQALSSIIYEINY
jgi:hypothetical protein